MSGSGTGTTVPGSVDGPGLLQLDRERATVEFQRLLHHPIEDVWEAITDPAQLEVWFMAKVTKQPGTGVLEMQHISGVHATGRVLRWDPPRIYEYEWNVAPGPALPDGETSIVRWELSVTKGGTLLVLTHRKLTARTGMVFARGLKTFLDRLAAQLDGAPLPEAPWLSQTRTAPGSGPT